MTDLLHAYGAAPTELIIGTPVRVLSAGLSNPILFRLEDEAGEPSDWVVKAPAGRSRLHTRLIREYVGSELAAWIGLPTPAIGLLRIPDDPPEADASEVGREAEALYRDNAGRTAFCSRYLEDATVLMGTELDHMGGLKPATIDDGIRVFVLDVFMHHHDRRPGNPNLLVRDDRLIAIDHGLAFPDLGRIDESGCPLVAPPNKVATELAKHVCAGIAKKQATSPTWALAAGRLLSLDDARIDELVGRVPDAFDRSTTGAPAGLKGDLAVSLRTQRDQLAAMLQMSRAAL